MPKREPSVAAWVIGMVVVGIVGITSVIASVMLVIFGAMRSSDPYKEGWKRAASDPRVIAVLGTPIKPGIWVNGQVKVENDAGEASIDFTIKGPKGKAEVYVEGTKTRGRWYYTRIMVVPLGGDTIDIIAPDEPSSEGSSSTAPPAD